MLEPVKLYNASCPSLAVLLKDLRRRRAPAGVWRRALLLTLARMGRRQESLARVTAVEILNVLSPQAFSTVHDTSATPRAVLKRFQAMAAQDYGRGRLTATQGYHPDVLELWRGMAARELVSLTRKGAEGLWRRLGGGRFPEALWDQLTPLKTAKARAQVFISRVVDYKDPESLKKALQRNRRRQRGQ